MRLYRDLPLLLIVGLVVAWCIVLPFVWAHNIDQHYAHMGYWQMLSFYVPELIVGAVVVVCLPFVFFRKRFSAVGLLLAAILGPALKFGIGSPSDAWAMSFFLLLLLSWMVHVRFSKQAQSANSNSA